MPIRLLLAVVVVVTTSAAAQSNKDDDRLDGRALIVHTLSRLTYGPTAELVAEVERKGLDKWIDEQLASSGLDEGTAAALQSYQSLDLTSAEIYTRYVNAQQNRRERQARVPYELLGSILLRAVENEYQAGEVMADFWRNHFNIDRNKGACEYLATEYDRTVVRDNVFGTFGDMLLASARHPAMLVYLDNYISRRPPNKTELKIVARRVRRTTGSKERGEEAAQIAAQRGLNENYARELLELHTVGVDNGYRQRDVVDVAEALTGWTVDTSKWEFQYRDDMHAHGDKFVMGFSIPRQKRRNGHIEGERIIDMLGRHKGTADFLATKMSTYLVSDEPPEKFVEAVARVLRKSHFDLAETTRFIVKSDEFRSKRHLRTKFKTPLEYVVSALRVTGAEITNPAALLAVLRDMGQAIYECEDPTGYRDVAESWRDPGVMALRWKFAMELSMGKIKGVRVPDEFFAEIRAKRGPSMVAALGGRVLPGGMRGGTIRVLMRVAKKHEEALLEWDAMTDEEREDEKAPPPLERRLLGVLLGAPEFQEQ